MRLRPPSIARDRCAGRRGRGGARLTPALAAGRAEVRGGAGEASRGVGATTANGGALLLARGRPAAGARTRPPDFVARVARARWRVMRRECGAQGRGEWPRALAKYPGGQRPRRPVASGTLSPFERGAGLGLSSAATARRSRFGANEHESGAGECVRRSPPPPAGGACRSPSEVMCGSIHQFGGWG